ncbi:MAG: hypothetical protein K5876_01225 [Ruminiclostridium sp.]|nr:hypothetical protein [Ruminiclostridium sp.]
MTSKHGYRLRTAAARIGGAVLFLLTVCYIFAALGILSLGLIAFPSVLLGRLGLLTVTSDLAPAALMLISSGILLVGAGMSLCIIPICSALINRLKSISRTVGILRKKASNETTEAS